MARAHVDPEAWKRKVRRRWIIGITLVLVLAVVLGGGWLVRNRIRPALRYSEAEKALERGAVQEAIDGFSLLRGYRDAGHRAAELAYEANPDRALLETLRQAELGSTVTFGSWEQDGDPENGQEPIRWIVMADDAGRILLWSEAVLDQLPYNETCVSTTWADATLRTWLNGTFYEQAFTPAEQLLIALTEVENADNTASGTKGGETTEDRVCILSFNELLAFAFYNPNLEQIYAYPTDYALSRGVECHAQWKTSPWWIRTPGIKQTCAAYCDMAGKPLYSGSVNHRGYGVRPMIWLFVPGRAE